MDSELPNMGNEPLGVVNSGTYTTASTRPANLAFLAAWTKEYGDKDIADFPAIQGWDGMAMIFDVIKKTAASSTATRRWRSSSTTRPRTVRGARS